MLRMNLSKPTLRISFALKSPASFPALTWRPRLAACFLLGGAPKMSAEAGDDPL